MLAGMGGRGVEKTQPKKMEGPLLYVNVKYATTVLINSHVEHEMAPAH